MIDEASTLAMYLSPPVLMPDGYTIKSSLWAVLLDARAVTGRDGATGQVIEADSSRAWIGALGYLTMLDQVGTAVARPSQPGIHDNGILRALTAFTSLTTAQRDAVVGLRNAFAHDYSLVSTDQRKGKIARNHRFQLTPDPGPLVILPAQQWSGSFDPVDGDDTLMSLREVGNLAEAVYAEVVRCHQAGDLEIGLAGGFLEMRARYFLRYMA